MKNLEIGSGVIVTAKCEENNRIDFISRCFYPKCGVNEDPVTGSAHLVLFLIGQRNWERII